MRTVGENEGEFAIKFLGKKEKLVEVLMGPER